MTQELNFQFSYTSEYRMEADDTPHIEHMVIFFINSNMAIFFINSKNS